MQNDKGRNPPGGETWRRGFLDGVKENSLCWYITEYTGVALVFIQYVNGWLLETELRRSTVGEGVAERDSGKHSAALD